MLSTQFVMGMAAVRPEQAGDRTRCYAPSLMLACMHDMGEGQGGRRGPRRTSRRPASASQDQIGDTRYWGADPSSRALWSSLTE